MNAQNNKSLACVFQIEFHEDGKTLQFATCETNVFDINVYCEPEVQVSCSRMYKTTYMYVVHIGLNPALYSVLSRA